MCLIKIGLIVGQLIAWIMALLMMFNPDGDFEEIRSKRNVTLCFIPFGWLWLIGEIIGKKFKELE